MGIRPPSLQSYSLHLVSDMGTWDSEEPSALHPCSPISTLPIGAQHAHSTLPPPRCLLFSTCRPSLLPLSRSSSAGPRALEPGDDFIQRGRWSSGGPGCALRRDGSPHITFLPPGWCSLTIQAPVLSTELGLSFTCPSSLRLPCPRTLLPSPTGQGETNHRSSTGLSPAARAGGSCSTVTAQEAPIRHSTWKHPGHRPYS